MGVEVPEKDLFAPRYNIAPTQMVAVIAEDKDGVRSLRQFKWGLIPFWAKDEKIGNSLINARAETIATKPAFRKSFEKCRCLVLADGFFEWQKLGALKQPMYLRKRNGEPFMFGGLWDRWKAPDGREVESFSIVTVEPNELAAKIHNRMPLMLDGDNGLTWVNRQSTPDQISRLLTPYPAERMECLPVSTIVSSPKYDGPECIAPISQITAVRDPKPIQQLLF